MNQRPVIPPATAVPPDLDLDDIVGYWVELPRLLWRSVFGLWALSSKTQFWNDSASFVSSDEVARIIARAILEARENVLPVGAIVPFFGEELPDGFLFCNGEEFQRADYPVLYANSPAGFILDSEKGITPDLRGRFLSGSPDVTTFGSVGGANSLTLDASNIPSHSHAYYRAEFGAQAIGEIPSVGATGLSFDQTGATGDGQPFDNRPAFMSVNYIIRAR